MRRLLLACLASLLLYAVLFGGVLDRPLALGFLQQQIDAKLRRGAGIAGPKLVILAGSNGPYSHRCQVIEPILGLPCVNGGVAVGLGLDYLFARWEADLHPGDIVYLPMEAEQYTRSRLASELGPDAAIMFRHDRHTLLTLTPERWIAAWFAFDLRALLMSVIEPVLLASGFHDPRAAVTGETNAWGDHVGHTEALAGANRKQLAMVTPPQFNANQIDAGYGTSLIGGFIDWATAHEVTVIGGLPTGFADAPLPDATIAAMRAVFVSRGAMFLELANHSRYKRGDFFDTAEHLNEPNQIAHSILLARQLAVMLGDRAGGTTAPAAREMCPRDR